MTSEAVLDSSPVAGEGLDRRVFGRRAKRAGGAVSTAVRSVGVNMRAATRSFS
jgi:hypothetical protein